MKYLNKLLALLLLITLSWLNSAFAQQGNIDANRMNRDINIMENILEEMFKIQGRSDGRGVALADGFFRSGRDVRGTYLPGYGVIFTIPTGNTPLIYNIGDDSERTFSYSFVYRNGENGDNKVDEETITRRIKEFLRDYGPTIGQLNPDEYVMVLYGHDREERHLVFYDSEGEGEEPSFPIISVAAQKGDLDAYRTGTINDQQFDQRISVSTLDKSEDRRLDLEVMANIFNTAFKEKQDEAGFRIRGSVNHLKLDNFGALFFFDVAYSSASSNVFRISLAPKVRISGDSQSEPQSQSRSRARVEVLRELDEEIEKEEQERVKREKELQENTRNAFADFKTRIKEYMIDYGRTLRSVGSDQFVMASITISTRMADIPERMDVQVRKSVLEAVDRGRMSREEALDQVTIREY